MTLKIIIAKFGHTKSCVRHIILHIPKIAYNVLSRDNERCEKCNRPFTTSIDKLKISLRTTRRSAEMSDIMRT